MSGAFDAREPLGDGITLLEASAGTGKTYSITSVVLNLVVVEGIEIDRILVVTFTDAATAELRDRIRRRLRAARQALRAVTSESACPPAVSDDDLIAHLVQRAIEEKCGEAWTRRLSTALQRFDVAPIRTIHSFCQALLRDYAFECAADVDAELLEDTRGLKEEIARDFWARHVASLPEDTLSLLRGEGDLSFEFAAALVSLSVDAPEVPLLGDERGAPSDSSGTKPPNEMDDVSRGLSAWRDALCAFEACWRAYRTTISADFARVEGANGLNKRTWPTGAVHALMEEVDRWVTEGGVAPAKLQRLLEAPDNKATNKGHSLHCGQELGELFGLFTRLGACGAAASRGLWRHCILFARAEWIRRKRDRRLQTFDDLLRDVHAALGNAEHGPALVTLVRERFVVALIDEFQDTDALQWDIFQTLFQSDTHRLVLIGDPKQSIYAFRGADIRTYLFARSQATHRRVLGVNRRSDDALVQAFGALFATHDMPFGTRVIESERVTAHHREPRVRTDGALTPPLRVLLTPRDGAFERLVSKGRILKTGAESLLARRVAADIARTIATPSLMIRSDASDAWRHVHAGDCAVLVRKGRQALATQRALRALGIPSVMSTDDSVFHSPEARDLLVLCRAILEPNQSSRLRRAFATDTLGIPAVHELLTNSRWTSSRTPCIADVLAEVEAEDERLDIWMARLRGWRSRWNEHGVMAMVRDVLAATSAPAALAALPDGERRLTNLVHLAELLHRATRTLSLSPSELVDWLARAIVADDDANDETRRVRLESDDRAVQLVTIHKSKGLEYSFVWAPWLWDGAVPGEGKAPRIVRDERGRRHISLDRLKSLGAEVQGVAADEELTESLRLLYVTLTRARHRCTVWWGAFTHGESSALGYLLHGTGGGSTAVARRASQEMVQSTFDAGDDAIKQALGALVVASDRKIAVEWDTLGAEGNGELLTEPPPVRTLRAREWSRKASLDDGWRLSSFTSMTRTLSERDLTSEAPEAAFDDAESAEDRGLSVAVRTPLFSSFAPSVRAGIALHAVLEALPFQPLSDAELLATVALARHGYSAPEYTRECLADFGRVFRTPLVANDVSFTLSDVQRDRRLDELAFAIPVGAAGRRSLGFHDVARAFASRTGGSVPDGYASIISKLSAPAFQGFLTGAMDCVVEHAGKFYLIDYKSNALGSTLDEYARPRLNIAMEAHHYFLQYHLYLVALDRWLTQRHAGYQWESHMGGVFYLFIRGMTPETRGETGVFYDLPPRERIEALGASMYGAEEALV